MELFDIIKKIFDRKKNSWDQVSNHYKSRNFFMINRIMAIQYPIQANQFNHIKVNPHSVVDWWWGTLSNRYTKQPNWIFTKTKKKEKKETPDRKDDFREAENFLKDKLEISSRDLSDLRYFFPDRYKDWMIKVSQQINVKIK
jgi:hypothetical protein